MRFDIEACPECGKSPIGTSEILEARADFEGDEAGGYEYTGHTEIFWESQETATEGNTIGLLCEEGHQWWAREIA